MIVSKMPKAKMKTKGATAAALDAARSAAASAPALGAPLGALPPPAADPPLASGLPPAADPPLPSGPPPAANPPVASGPPPAAATAGGRDIISDAEAYLFIKQTSREAYKAGWEAFRASCAAQAEFEVRTPNEKELLDYFVMLREGRRLEDGNKEEGKKEEGKAGTTILTTYSLLNGVMKHKYSFNMREFPRIGARIKVWISEDIKKKAAVFTPGELKAFCEAEDLEGGYWEVRKAIVVLAYFGGLRLTEAMGLQVEKISPCAGGFDVIHDRAKGRTTSPAPNTQCPRRRSPRRERRRLWRIAMIGLPAWASTSGG